MPTGLSAVGFVVLGMAVAFAGTVCVASVPLVGWTWFSRTFFVVTVTLCAASAVWLTGFAQVGDEEPATPAAIAVVTLLYGVPIFLVLVAVTVGFFRSTQYRLVPYRRMVDLGIWFIPLGAAVVLIPSVLTLLGVPVR